MKITYSKFLVKKEVTKLEKNGWKVNPLDRPFGSYIGESASKNFKKPADAMFEIEKIFKVDVIQDVCQDGCAIHTFSWEKSPEELKTANKYESHNVAMGWDCAVCMLDAPKTPRETAIELQKLRNS